MKLQKNTKQKFRIKYKIVNANFVYGRYQKKINLFGLEYYDFNTIRYSLQESLIKYFPIRHKNEITGFRANWYAIKSIICTLREIQKIRNEIRHIHF